MHAGIETVLCYVLKLAYIIEGRSLVKLTKRCCERCLYLLKKTVEVCMGPVSEYSMIISPAFYITQVDLAGPFKAFSSHNKRTTIKVWFTVFCCTTTSAVIIKIMDDYSVTAFIQSFVRFSYEVGYPKMLLPELYKCCGQCSRDGDIVLMITWCEKLPNTDKYGPDLSVFRL